MAASVAHELNNYLSIIANNAELMSVNIEREKYDKVRFNAKSITDNIFRSRNSSTPDGLLQTGTGVHQLPISSTH